MIVRQFLCHEFSDGVPNVRPDFYYGDVEVLCQVTDLVYDELQLVFNSVDRVVSSGREEVSILYDVPDGLRYFPELWVG